MHYQELEQQQTAAISRPPVRYSPLRPLPLIHIGNLFQLDSLARADLHIECFSRQAYILRQRANALVTSKAI